MAKALNHFGLQPEFEISVPFEYRHQCWFCAEPANKAFTFPHSGHLVIDCPHPPLIVPSCKECHAIAASIKKDSIWQVLQAVKAKLIEKYRKDLAIGLNWTKESLAESQFEGGNFEGFQKSAWFMYEVAKGRVNFTPWPIELNGQLLEANFDKAVFCFDGVDYPCVDEAIKHYTLTFDIPINFFKQVLAKVGLDDFSYAVRYCRLFKGGTPQELHAAIKVL